MNFYGTVVALFSFWLCLLCYGQQSERNNVKNSVAPDFILALDISKNVKKTTLQYLTASLKRSMTDIVKPLDSVRIISTKCCHSNSSKTFEDCVSSFSFPASGKGNLEMALEKALQVNSPCERNIAGPPERKMHQTSNSFLVLITNAAERKENYELLEKATENGKIQCAVVYLGRNQQPTQNAQDDLLLYLKSRVASDPKLFFQAYRFKQLNRILSNVNVAAKNFFEKKILSGKPLARHKAAPTENNSSFSVQKLNFNEAGKHSSQRTQQTLPMSSNDEQRSSDVQKAHNKHDIAAAVHRRVVNTDLYSKPVSASLPETSHIIPNNISNHVEQTIGNNDAAFSESRLIKTVAGSSTGINTSSFDSFDMAERTNDTTIPSLGDSERTFANGPPVFLYLDRVKKFPYKYGFWTRHSKAVTILLFLLCVYFLLPLMKPIFRRIALLRINRALFINKASIARC
ncbi:hypothetical protein M513_10638 [Trichuris suis]|nr:hypothetical protein M513_10638 [Trichuris suis]